MTSDDEAETSTPGGPEPTVRCDACGNLVQAEATDEVPRVYLERTFIETWCKLCSASLQEATKTTLGKDEDEDDDEPDY